MPDLRLATIAANRFGFGARPGELRAIASDPRGWVKGQLGPQAAPPAQIAALPAAEEDLLAFGRWVARRRLSNGNAQRMEERAERQGISQEQLRMLSTEEDFVENFRERVQRAVSARLEAAITSERPVHERLVHFWSNHFTVSAAKPAAVALPPSFEKDAIRPHVGGRFADMLLASTKHPGMIVYLDNRLSIGPNSQAAQQPRRARRLPGGGRPTGINENLAREILELHTLGVNGGYTQADVQALAAIITGWTYERPRLRDLVQESGGARAGAQLFEFDAAAHEPGPKTLLRRTYAQQRNGARRSGARRSRAPPLHRALHRHQALPPLHRRRAAGRGCRARGASVHAMRTAICAPRWTLWSIAPKRGTRRWRSSNGPRNTRSRCCAPRMCARCRPALGLRAMTAMGQRTYAAPGPDGWADNAEAWLTADLVWKRLEFAQTFSERIARADVNPIDLGQACLGPLLSEETATAVRRAESPAQGLAILFGAPEMQRR